MMTGLSRKIFFEKHNIPENTLRIWENPAENRNGITSNGAFKFSEALKKEGIVCSASWLLNGLGPTPIFSNQELTNTFKADHSWSDDEAILKEVEFFLGLHKNSVSLMISDNALAPIFNVGDFVCGILRPADNLEQFLNKISLVKTEEYGTLARLLKLVSNNIILCATNPDTDSDYIINDAKITSIAEITWIRKRQTINGI